MVAIRIGLGMHQWPFPSKDPALFWEYIAMAEELGIDSFWLSEMVLSPREGPTASGLFLDTLTALSFVAARTKKMKFGTDVLTMPVHNPTLLAKEVATLDLLSQGRTLLAVGLGPADESYYEACGVRKNQRAGRTDEAIELVRRLWSQDGVTFHGRYFTLNNVTVQPKPVQKHLPPIWIGGNSEPALRRTARLGDGWLPSSITPDEVGRGIQKIQAMTEEFSRTIEDDHFGVSLRYCIAGSRGEALDLARPYTRFRDGLPLEEYSCIGTADDMARLLERHIEAGATKFVAKPACPPDHTVKQLELLGRLIIPRFHN